MTGRGQPKGHLVDLQPRAIAQRLQATAGLRAIAAFHHRQRRRGGQHLAMTGTGVVGMAVGDQRPGHARRRVNIKIARFAVETLICDRQPTFGSRLHALLCRKASANTALVHCIASSFLKVS